MARQPAPEAHYVSQFERTEQNGAASSPAWLRGLRQEAIADFARLGFPVARRGNELWKYTDIRPIAEARFPMAADRLDPGVLEAVGARFHDFDLPCPRVHQLVFIDGHYARSLSTEPPSEAGMAAETRSVTTARGSRSGGLPTASTVGSADCRSTWAATRNTARMHSPR